jgi:hypothetical protein
LLNKKFYNFGAPKKIHPMAEETKPKYNCTQQELYAILGLAINNLAEDKSKFLEKSTNYDDAFIDGQRVLVGAAIGLPNEEQRNGVHQNLKGLLPGLLEPIKQDFRDLQEYIRMGWPDENPTPRYEQAGLVNYNKIGTSNWENVQGLNKNMDDFTADAANVTLLTTPGGMVPTFVAGIATHYTAFKTKYDLFMSSKETATATAEKIKADNTAYASVMKFMTFGVNSVFRNDAEAQKRYTFIALKNQVSPPGSAGLIVKVKKGDDTIVTTGTVTIKEEGQPAITVNINAAGEAVFTNVNPADYTGYVTVNGVRTNFVKTVNTGTDARITVVIA